MIKTVGASHADECQILCQAEESCEYFTYVTGKISTALENEIEKCRMFSEIDGDFLEGDKVGHFSGPKECLGIQGEAMEI